jgi:hypothetical protein
MKIAFGKIDAAFATSPAHTLVDSKLPMFH